MSSAKSPFDTATFTTVDLGAFAGLLSSTEECLQDAVRGYGAFIERASRATLTAGGKRLRPLLVFICAAGESGPGVVRAAASVELVHMATLVHDDVIDGADLRRGRPTVASHWGQQAAVGVGDFLFARAFGLLAENDAGDEAAILARSCLDLARGELVQRLDANDAEMTRERYFRRCKLKTASLFAAACALGAVEGGQSRDVVSELMSFGSGIGLAFQIMDDVLDISGDPTLTGKPLGTDLRDGTVTLPLILAGRRRPHIVERALEARTDSEIESVCKEIAETGALDEAREEALRLVGDTLDRVLASQFSEDSKEILKAVADGAVERFA